MFKRSLVLLYGVVCYVAFLASFLYAVGFVSNLLVPHSIDSAPEGGFVSSLLIDLGLLTIFALQHSVMARPAFKRWWTRFVPVVAERSTYVLAASLALILLFAYWRPLGGIVWNVDGPVSAAMLYGLCAFGFLLVLVSTFLIDHFDLFGLRQVWLYFIGKPYKPIGFRTPGSVSTHPSSALRRISVRVLGNAGHVDGAPRVRHCDDLLHPDCDPARRARSHRRPWRCVSRLSQARADADSVRGRPRAEHEWRHDLSGIRSDHAPIAA